MTIEGDADAIAKVLRAGRSGVVRDLSRAGVKIVSRIRLTLSTPGTGTLYTTEFRTGRGGGVFPIGTRVPHRASAPGQPPARDTGALAASVSAHAARAADGATLDIGSSNEAAPHTEFGSGPTARRHTHVAARPWLRPTMAASHDVISGETSEGIEGRERAMARRLGGKG